MAAKRTPKKTASRKKKAAKAPAGKTVRAKAASQAKKKTAKASKPKRKAAPARKTKKTKTTKAVAKSTKKKTAKAAPALPAARPPKKATKKKAVARKPQRPPLDLRGFRRHLRRKQAELLQAYESAKGDTRQRQTDGTEDYIDYAVSSYDREFLLSLTEMEQGQLMLVEEALKRIDKGRFGNCSQCDKPIPAKRLEVQPWARYCIQCQEVADQGLMDDSLDDDSDDDDDDLDDDDVESDIAAPAAGASRRISR